MDAAINPHKNGSAVMAFVWNDGVTLGGEVLTARDTRRLRRGIIWLEFGSQKNSSTEINQLSNKKMHWLTSSALSAVFGAVYVLLLSYLVKHIAPNTSLLVCLLGVYAVACIGVFAYLLLTSSLRNIWATCGAFSPWMYVVLIGAAVAFVLSTLCFAHGFRHAPNPAYVVSVANSNAILVLLATLVVAYGVNWRAAVGVVVTFVGLAMVGVYSS